MTHLNDKPSSRAARLSVLFAGLGAAIASVGALGARFGVVAPYSGFALFGLGMILGGLLAVVLGVVGLVRTREACGRRGRGWALCGLVLGGAMWATLLSFALPARGAPPIHDITTDPDDPPIFREVASLPANAERDLAYPHGGPSVVEAQRAAYPDLAPLELAQAPGAVYEAARRVVDEMGWDLVWSNRDLGWIEASETSEMFRFVDDIAIRIRPRGDGSLVDLRSTSRVGISDLGANARRIRAFGERLAAALDGAP